MKKIIRKDTQKRKITNQFESDLFIYKSIFKNENFSNNVKWNSLIKINSLPLDSHSTRIGKRCVFSGRKSNFNNLFKFSRLVFLKLVRNGDINGIKKSSW